MTLVCKWGFCIARIHEATAQAATPDKDLRSSESVSHIWAAIPDEKARGLGLLQVVGRGDLEALQATVLHGLVYSAGPSGRG